MLATACGGRIFCSRPTFDFSNGPARVLAILKKKNTKLAYFLGIWMDVHTVNCGEVRCFGQIMIHLTIILPSL
jgi:hypothetical protein